MNVMSSIKSGDMRFSTFLVHFFRYAFSEFSSTKEEQVKNVEEQEKLLFYKIREWKRSCGTYHSQRAF